MPILDHFGLIAPYYDRLIQQPQVDKFIGVMDLPITGRLLDAGGGTGRVGHVLKGLVSQVVVADLSIRMLGQARLKPEMDLACAYTERLPFKNECFERVVMVDALHHVVNQVETSHELWRVLKPGGCMVIVEPDVRSFEGKLVSIAEKMLQMRSHFFSPEQISDMIRNEKAVCHLEQDGFNTWVIFDKH